MDAADEISLRIESTMLSYDDTVAYEEQLPTEEEVAATGSLANRIGNSRVYLLSESTAATARTTKVRLVP
jgi:ATP:corrinoid adenosyltransferase